MKPPARSIPSAMALALLALTAGAADPPSPVSAKDLAANLSTLQQDGSSYVRLKMDLMRQPGAPKVTMQLQIKQRRTPALTEAVYQVLWPKERAGEAVLLQRMGDRPARGSHFTPPNTVRPLDDSQMQEALFGGDLAYRDVIENFFAWDRQTIIGTEIVDRVNCQILESKPGKGQHSDYVAVRTWVDGRRMVPLRIEKYLPSGELALRIDTTLVVTDDLGRPVPGNLAIRGSQNDATTVIEGSRLRHGVNYADREFTPEGLSELAPPRSAAE